MKVEHVVTLLVESGGVESSRVEVSCVVMVQSSCVAEVELSRVEVS